MRFLSFLFLAVFLLASNASAQFLPGATKKTEEAASGVEALIRDAQKDGSTIIVVTPGQQNDGADQNAENSKRSELFLRARARIQNTIASLPTLWPAIKRTIIEASPDGGWFWILRGIGTTVIGLLLATFITGRTFRWIDSNFDWMTPGDPQTQADKVKYLLIRTGLAVFLVSMAIFSAFAVAVVLDSGHEPTRRLIFELIMANAVYRFLRHGVSWNLFAGAMPKHRLVNLNDDEAVTIHRDWHVGVLIAAAFAAFARFVTFTAEDLREAGTAGVLLKEHDLLLQMCAALLITLLVILIVVKNWRAMQHIVAPREPTAIWYRARTALAKLVPVAMVIYAVVALIAFAYRQALNVPEPGLVLAAPFLVIYVAVLVYGVVLLVIQTYYNRRERVFRARYEHEKANQDLNTTVRDEETGEEMVVNTIKMPEFEFQPVFRSFFENGALAIIITIALGELARMWGVEVGSDGNVWASFLDIALAAALCWMAYRAVTIYIDRKLEEEGGVPEADEELGGEGGGAGATRMATLLPIMRYVMTITLFSIAGMVILSRMGFDIGPIFAGAGVVGIAVGFGAQTLIRDIFSGAFFLMDDAFRKGEYVEIEGIKGVVEKISIRSFQLRHHLGALHTIPFGEIRQLTNYSRDWVLMKLPLRVTYDTDVDRVRKLVKKLGQELMNHPQVGHTFMQPLKSQGVYKMEDSAMIIRVKFMTKPGEQFVTRKVVYESIQDLFAREGIKFAHKEVTVRLADDQNAENLTEQEKKAVTAAARSVLDEEQAAREAASGGKPADDGR